MGELRPQVLDALGLVGALRDEVELFGRATGMRPASRRRCRRG
jgi:signal transduction histidine kinase